MLLKRNVLRTKIVSWVEQMKSLVNGLEEKFANEAITQKAEKKT